jgi:glycosyltransferase involved in cell wall biosynthesis
MTDARHHPTLLRILIIADSKIPVPPERYGGTERIVASLCAGLSSRGHAVTLMAAPGSRNYGRLVAYPWAGESRKLYRGFCKLNFTLKLMHELVRGHDVAISHGRVDYLFPILRSSMPLIYVFHNPIVDWILEILHNKKTERLRLISVSNKQRAGYPDRQWTTIYNSIDTSRYLFNERSRRPPYLAFLGRLTENKGVDLAIDVAKRTGLPLCIAGNVSDEAGGKEFFESKVRVRLDDTIRWIGDISDDEKSDFLGGACALLAPIRWDDPCPVVCSESLACGTPVIAMRRGAMPELIQDGINGFLVSSEVEMAQAVANIDAISRHACRADCEARFGTDLMISRYLNIIRSLVGEETDRTFG